MYVYIVNIKQFMLQAMDVIVKDQLTNEFKENTK